MEGFVGRGQELVAAFGYKAIAALLILVVGRWVAKAVRNVTRRMMGRSEMDATLVSFIESLVYYTILAFAVLAALAQLGIQTTSFIALIGAAGLAVGLALQGSLANFASGVLLLLFRPFKVGDYIEGAGVAGVVEEIHIFTTLLSTLDNKAIIIPNSKLTGDNITNYTRKDKRRVDLVFGVAPGNDIDLVKRVIAGVLESDARILKDPAPTIAVQGIAVGVLEFAVRPWVRTEDYWDVFFSTNENMKKRFDAEGIRG
ncbi:MAG: mechanosensitive ion channel, partial [Deltaproteobacteria bacterium]|nr:mechanosensitive ion channel [Deltaproteobacteria bacterium]